MVGLTYPAFNKTSYFPKLAHITDTFPPTIENSQTPSFFPYMLPPPPMNFMQNNQSPSIENSQTPSFFPTCHNHHQLFLCKIMNPPPQKILKLFLQCHETILPCFVCLLNTF